MSHGATSCCWCPQRRLCRVVDGHFQRASVLADGQLSISTGLRQATVNFGSAKLKSRKFGGRSQRQRLPFDGALKHVSNALKRGLIRSCSRPHSRCKAPRPLNSLRRRHISVCPELRTLIGPNPAQNPGRVACKNDPLPNPSPEIEIFRYR